MDISLIMGLSFLKTWIHVAEVYLEGSVSQNFDIKNKRHSSLDKNVFYAWLKADTCRSNIKRDIHVQKIKVENSLINSLLLK